MSEAHALSRLRQKRDALSPLARPFKALVFDWDGTAVASRQEDATDIARVLDELLGLGAWIVVVTGTSVGHVHRQVGRRLAPRRRRRLLVCANRGSEVYGYSARGTLVRRWWRRATPAEDQALTDVANAVRDAVASATGLTVDVVYDRLNRRKIDVIPLPEWADPPKTAMGALLAAVQSRLQGAGLGGGLAAVVALTRGVAAERGLPDARITSDVKHVEVGLTDKGDALAWIRRRLLASEQIAVRDVLVAGDEFGPVAGFPGSDDRLRQGAAGAVVISVGAEPNGVPAGVVHLGGGPARFAAVLAEQVRLQHERLAAAPAAGKSAQRATGWLDAALAPPVDAGWRLEERGYWPALEHEVETRLALGNGALGSRASLEQPTAASRPRTFIAGLFGQRHDQPPVPALVPGPDWMRLDVAIDGERLAPGDAATVSLCRALDLRRGVLLAEWVRRDQHGREVHVRTLRLLFQVDRSIAAQVALVRAPPGAQVTLEARLEPPTGDLRLASATGPAAAWTTRSSARYLATACRAALRVNGRRTRYLRGAAGTWRWSPPSGEPAVFTRLTAVARAHPGEDAGGHALAEVARAQRSGFHRLLAAHERAWAARWEASDVIVEGDAAAQRALRFAVYHLLAAANPGDEHVSIGARALTGDAYLGHVFWDTEIFLLPFYTFTWPAAARALLMYRYHTLPAARAKAARLGYPGALYAWESADGGEETTPTWVVGPDGRLVRIRCGVEEQHISADVAYAVWQYWQATDDALFLLQAGAEILLETARFWASRATREEDGSCHLRDVIGPDEYHEGVDDNAYTNGLARWNLERGLEVAELLATRWPGRWAELRGALGIAEVELARWRDVAERVALGVDPSTGIVEQFAGFSRLEPLDLTPYAQRTAPIDVLLGRERATRSQVIKQADVVMLMALLPDRFPPAQVEANFAYYEPRCAHGSSLSPGVHALVAARLGRLSLAERYFRQAAAIDLDDRMGNAALGVHVGALGGLWQAVVLGFAGLSLAPGGLRFAPHVPLAWRRLAFRVHWRGRRLLVELDSRQEVLTATLEQGDRLTVCVGALAEPLDPGTSVSCRYTDRSGSQRKGAA